VYKINSSFFLKYKINIIFHRHISSGVSGWIVSWALGERLDKTEEKPSSAAFTLLGTAMLWVYKLYL
jgi:hypothetical protein